MLSVLQRMFFGARLGRRYDPTKKISLWALDKGKGAALRLKSAEGYEFTKLTVDELHDLRATVDKILDQTRKHDHD